MPDLEEWRASQINARGPSYSECITDLDERTESNILKSAAEHETGIVNCKEDAKRIGKAIAKLTR